MQKERIVKIENIPYDDKATWNLICNGNTVGCFQIDSSIGTRVVKMVGPSNIKELSECVALQRPPCLIKDADGKNILEKYCEIKWGRADESYIHEALRPILSGTYSLIIFQEQVIRIANEIAGYSLEHADVLRSAVGKKKVDVMEAEREEFIAGVVKNGYGDEVAKILWEYIENSSSYLFNLSHAVEYAYLTYQTAYLKTHYPIEFMTSLLAFSKYENDSEEELEKLHNECKRVGIKLLPPSIKLLNEDFKILSDTEIAFGLSHIRGVGDASIKKLSSIGVNKYLAKYEDFLKFISEKRVNKKVVEGLILSGALDIFGISRKYMFNLYSLLIELTPREEEKLWELYAISHSNPPLEDCVESMIDSGFVNKKRGPALKEIFGGLNFSRQEFPITNLLLHEKHFLNITISGSLVDCIEPIKNKLNHRLIDIRMCRKDEKVQTGGVVENVKEILTRKGDKMAFVSISDFTYKTDVVVFPNIWAEEGEKIVIGSVLYVAGKADRGSVVANRVEVYKVEPIKEGTSKDENSN